MFGKRKFRVAIASLAIVSIFLTSAWMTPLAYAFVNGQSASVVIGFDNFTSRSGRSSSSPTASNLLSPDQVAFDSSGNMWVADSSNGRVLEFTAPFSSGESATTVLGTANFVSDGSLSSANKTNLPEPQGLAFDSAGNLWVSDGLANRIVEFKAPFTNGENESVVLGAADFVGSYNQNNVANKSDLAAPAGIAFDPSGNLWVADQGFNRVVEFKAPLTTGESENTVIGQTNFTLGVQDIPGCPQQCKALTSPASLNGPLAVAFDKSGNLWVGDSHGGRVLKFNAPLSTGESASVGLGVVDLNTPPGLFCITGGPYCIGFPDSLAFDKSGNLWVSDDTNGRVLEFPQPFSTNESASMVVGQPNFTSISPVAGPSAFNASQSDMYGNDGVAIDQSGNLWVSDGLDNRVLEFSASAAGSASSTSPASSSSSSAGASSSVSSSISVTTGGPSASSSLQSTAHSTTAILTTTTAAAPSSSSSSKSSSSSAIAPGYVGGIAVVLAVMACTLAIVLRRRRLSGAIPGGDAPSAAPWAAP